MRHILIFCFLFLFSFSSFAQESFDFKGISAPVTKIIKKIETFEKVESKHINHGGNLSEQYADFEALKKNASQAELQKLRKHPNPIVRAHVLWALLDYQSIDPYALVQDNLNDRTQFQHLSGCIEMPTSMARFLYFHAQRRLSKKQTKKLKKLLPAF